MRKITSACIAVLFVFFLSGMCMASARPSLTIRPNQVGIGAGFNGTHVSIAGEVPEGTSAVIRLLGEPRDETFKEKGKALGVLWMNLKTVEIKDVPDVFLMGTDGTDHIDWEHSDLAFQSAKGDTDNQVFDEFLKLMEQEQFYQVENGVVQYEQSENGMRPFTADLAIPSAMHQGVYRVEVLAVKEGKVVDSAAEELHTKLTGLPAFLARLAFENSLLYGVAAVVIAILAGLFMSMLFKERGGAH